MTKLPPTQARRFSRLDDRRLPHDAAGHRFPCRRAAATAEKNACHGLLRLWRACVRYTCDEATRRRRSRRRHIDDKAPSWVGHTPRRYFYQMISLDTADTAFICTPSRC